MRRGLLPWKKVKGEIVYTSKMFYNIYSTPSTAPSNSTQNVRVTAVFPRAMTIEWDEVPPIHQNGKITKDEIRIEPKQTFDGLISTKTVNTSDGSVLLMVITDLEECVEYCITVRAHNSAGPGPYSDPITARTQTNSKRYV